MFYLSAKENGHPYGCPFFGGDKRDRTADLLNAIQALSQLSYTPIFFAVIAADLLNIPDRPRKVKPIFSKNEKIFAPEGNGGQSLAAGAEL